ncbi:hypothetical protein HU200_043335 [Digitaria exilis]|uniref:F-box domain-containing protein n=1 Tax=Digitaria exilis TaxID=1010633 RepID=A0A835EHH6_9POAL|nr:hypothetical protein HU200_043335 [Digitaria exilis]
MEAAEPAKRNPAASLPDEILVEILRRLPVRSVCRFKCVSRSWRDLISDPAHRKKLPQTLTGFFYSSYNEERFPSSARHFTNITGKGGAPLIVPSLSFLLAATDNADDVELMDSCNGLLLCHCRCFGLVLMRTIGIHRSIMLCAIRRPTVSSHFYVVEYVLDEDSCVAGVEIYSSKTAAWSFKENEWGSDIMLHDSSVFLNGFMHMVTFADGVAVVDMEGKIWRTIPVPSNGELGRVHRSKGWIHQSQGRLCFLDGSDRSKLSIWTLENHASNEWTLKHSVGMMFLFRQKNLLAPFEFDLGYTLVAFHPECNLIYFVYGLDKTLMAYDMDRKEVRVIRNLGYDCSKPYLPYVPWFSEALADEQ